MSGKKGKYDRLGHYTALGTFLIASLVFWLFAYTGESTYSFLGFFLVVLGVPINIIVAIVIVLNAGKSANPKRIYTGLGLLFVNIPIAIVYIGLGIYLMSFIRLTVENTLPDAVKSIKIEGCDDAKISELKPGESKTVWLEIDGDCSVEISYKDSKGVDKKETIVGYITNGDGRSIKWHFGQGEAAW